MIRTNPKSPREINALGLFAVRSNSKECAISRGMAGVESGVLRLPPLPPTAKYPMAALNTLDAKTVQNVKPSEKP
jgi:hypothetical protein